MTRSLNRGGRPPLESRLPLPLLILVLAAVILVPGGAGLALSPSPPPPPPPPKVAFEPYVVPADAGPRVEGELGRFKVPEDRRKPQGRQLELAFVRLKSTAQRPGSPIVYLAGGPGGAATAALEGKRLEVLLALRDGADVIAFDQRGTGLSAPQPTCAETWMPPLDRPLDRGEMLAAARQHSRACVAALREEGVDLAVYNTSASADDLEDLRLVLGARKISLLGISYGSHLALEVMRRHPASLDRVVLAGVEGPDQMLRLPSDVERLIETVSLLARDDPRAAMPDLRGSLRRLLERLARQPETVEVEVPLALRRVRVTVGRADLEWMLAHRLASREGIAGLPALVHEMEGGDFTALGIFAQNMRRGWLGAAMPYAVLCTSGASAERLARIHQEQAHVLLAGDLDFPFPGICDAWGVPDLGAAFRAPVRSSVPALLVSGTLDARTPPANAKEVRAGLAKGVELIVEGGGHGDDLLTSSPEATGLVRRFLRGEAVADTRIAAPRLEFLPSPAAAAAHQASPAPRLEVAGLRINVLDLDGALSFYRDLLGAELVSRGRDQAQVRSGGVRITLHRVEGVVQTEYPRQADIHVNYQVKDLAALTGEMRARGVKVLEAAPQKAAIGIFNTVRDPAGNLLQLLQLDKPSAGLTAPRVFNVDVRVTNAAEARAFYTGVLGFEVFSEDFYPPTVPLKKLGAVALVLQEEASAKAPVGFSQVARTIVQLATPDLAATRAELGRRGLRFLDFPQEQGQSSIVALADPAGNVLELVEAPRGGARR